MKFTFHLEQVDYYKQTIEIEAENEAEAERLLKLEVRDNPLETREDSLVKTMLMYAPEEHLYYVVTDTKGNTLNEGTKILLFPKREAERMKRIHLAFRIRQVTVIDVCSNRFKLPDKYLKLLQ